MFQGSCSSSTSPPSPTPPSSTPPSGCGSPQWQGDGYCDDENNNEACQWDGGDCCGENVNTIYCSACECLDPNHGGEPECEDMWNTKICEWIMNKGKCNKKWAKKYCQLTCGYCGQQKI